MMHFNLKHLLVFTKIFVLVPIVAGSFSFGVHTILLANAVGSGAFEIYATIESIGIEWDVTGDDDHDAVCTVQYKKVGNPSYGVAKPLYRVDFETYNMMAGSILFLEPNTAYEIQLNLSDPDGGSFTKTETITTRAVPTLPTVGSTYHVVPGSGGGTGSSVDPFKGIAAAEAVAQPGDIFLLHGGDYGEVVLFNKAGAPNAHIVWKSSGDGDPVFRGVRLQANYLWLEGLKIVDQYYGLRTSEPGPVGVVVTHCHFENNHYGIFLNDGGDGWYITDNTIIGNNTPGTSDFSGEGIELWYTNNHTVAYNSISKVADGISYPGKNVDMHNNDIYDTTDDGIEFDYCHANNRAWANRITNVFNNGISFQPMNGAPAYVLRNQVSVLNNENVLKLRTRTDRALIAHNTFVINSGPVASGAEYLANFELKNNLWISINDRYAWENSTSTDINWRSDFDHNGFDWGNATYGFKWANTRHVDLAALYAATGQEEHGITIDYQSCLNDLNFTLNGIDVLAYERRHYTLKSGCNALDAGVQLANINDDYLGNAPDLGAYESGMAIPHYGVRDACVQHLTNIWQGPDNSYWHQTQANWSLNRFPEACDHVLIPSNKKVKVESGQTAQGYSLEVENTGTLECESNAKLQIQTNPQI